ncbi:hypothetical protein TW81_06410 [Vibrio galatheae]|uniref:Endonuclease/exonuclease/phosphatase domain-containing protein n=1 Tax=Vibrio galatheae TaxID=579748 RepID=A0A0F4NM56_9VIBR|nr:endonuclease/exonuclease/phosphatase family protein [Vibrio galatheae]KJY83954.1 hypothetical protein TW81_06410 [Vibrio galatheae]
MLTAKTRLLILTLALFSLNTLANDKLSYATWNLEWLTSQPSDKFPASQRSKKDFDALNRYFVTLNSDVLAFQEVADLDALRKVIGDSYTIYLSQRSLESNQRYQFTDINQYTGVAIKHGIKAANMPDLKLDNDANSKLRFATYVVINADAQPLHLLSVHLKARCSGAYKDGRACRTLKRQSQAINHWIKQREDSGEVYVIAGDFNHNLAYGGDWMWQDLSEGTTAQLATSTTPALCKVRSRNQPDKTHQFRSLIDHVVTSKQLEVSEVKQQVYQVDDLFKYQLSDHCPMQFTLY